MTTNRVIIAEIKEICEDYEYYFRADHGDDGEPTLQSIQEIVNAQLGYAFRI